MLVHMFLILGLLQGSPQAEAVPQGVITVNVVNENGVPLIDADVWMLSLDGKARVSFVPSCSTDWTGTCSYAHLPVGKYLITAMKVADGYPNGEAPLFNRNRTPVIAEILPDKLNVRVSYKAGPKAAAIVLDVVDAVTDVQIKNPTIVLRSPTDPKIWMGASRDANSRVLIPPDEDILVEVLQEGYKPWHMETQPGATHANALNLHSEELKQFTIRLVPK
jgi:hypothetical protein